MTKIRVLHHPDADVDEQWEAYFVDAADVYTYGRTKESALGPLILTYQRDFENGLSVEIARCKNHHCCSLTNKK